MPKKSNKGKKPAAEAGSSGNTLYVLAGSANSHGCMALVSEAKLPYDFKALDAMKGETRTPEYMAKNPFHCCPTLEEGSLVIWESNTILRYLCNKHNLTQWFPTDAAVRGKVEQALDWRQTMLYPAMAKCVYAPLGFAKPDGKKENEGRQGTKEQLEMLEKHYLKDGKFVNGNDKPTIADLSIRPPLAMLAILDWEFSPAIQAYLDRFDKAVPSYVELAKPLVGYIAMKKSQNDAAKDDKKSKKAAKKEKNKQNNNKNQKKKGKAEPEAKSASGLDAKREKACIKEGGKKGQDLQGMSAFGVHFFCTSFDEPKGEMEYLELCMTAANRKVDPDAEDRKGGAGDLGKIFFSAGDTNLAMIAHCPPEVQDKVEIKEWFGEVCKSIGAKPSGEATKEFMRANMPANPDANQFPLKMRDVAIGAGFAYLKKKGLVLDDDSDDDINYADQCGIDLNAGPPKDDGYGDY